MNSQNGLEDSYDLACKLQKAGKFEEAITAYQACRTPEAFNTLLEIGQCYKKLDNLNTALSWFIKAEKKHITDAQKAKVSRCLAEIYNRLYKQTNKNEYLLSFKKTLDNWPNKTDPEYKYQLAGYYYTTNQIQSAKVLLSI